MTNQSYGTCRYWLGRWLGPLEDGKGSEDRDDKYDTFYGLNGTQVTYGACHRYPPRLLESENMTSHKRQEEFNALFEDDGETFKETEEEKTKRRRRDQLLDELSNVEEILEGRPFGVDNERAKRFEIMEELRDLASVSDIEAKKEALWEKAFNNHFTVGSWARTRSSDWCGEYQKDQEKADRLQKNN